MKPHSGLVLALLLFLPSFAQAQVLVGEFNIITKNVGQIRATAYGNNVLVYGAIDHLNGDYQGRLLLFNALGERINTFASVYADGVIWDVQTQTDGKILISGHFTMINDIPATGLARLNSDGTADHTFNAAVSGVEDLTLQSDGKIIVRIGGQLKRLNTDGSLDNDFTSASDAVGYSNVETGSDDAIYYAAGRTVKKLLADGSVDPEFSSGPTDTNGYPYGIKSMPDGTLLVFGTFTSYNGEERSRMVKVNADGSIAGDFTFDPSVNGFIRRVELRADHSIVVAGELVTPDGNQRLIQINSAGTLVRAIADGGPSFYSAIERISQTNDGKIIAVGDFSVVNGLRRPGLVMFNDDYTISDFRPEVSSMLLYYNSASVAPCGPLYFLTGYIPGIFTNDLPYEVIIAEDGSVTEAPSGLTGLNHLGFQNDNKILMFNNSVERRYSDGSADNSFSFTHGGDIPFEVPSTSCFREFNEKLYIAGQFANFYGHNSRSLIALNKDGAIDKTYDALPPGSSVTSMAFQSDGKIVLAGYFPMEGYTDATHVIRLNTDGSLDAEFNARLLANPDAKNTHDIAVDAYDRIYVTGYNTSSVKYSITRVNADGTSDDSFNGGAFTYDSPSITHNLITLLPDNTLMVGGNFAGYKGTAIRSLAHLDQNGDLLPLSNVQFGRGTTVTLMEYAAGSLYMTGYFVRSDYKAVSAIAKVFFENVSIPPGKPVGLSSTYSAPKVTLTWNDKSNNENFYILQRATVNSAGDFVSIDTLDENLNFAYDLDATKPGTYHYRIKAVNCFGEALSDVVSVTIPDPTVAPSAPSLLEASLEDNNAHISWTDNSANEDYFVLERYTDDNHAALSSSDTVDANVNTFIYKDISANVKFNFRVRAENGAGYSAWSNVASLILELPPPVPSGLSVSLHAEGVALAQWQDPSNLETYFVLERSKDGSTELVYDTIAANTTSVLSSGIDAHQTYYFRIRSVNEVGSSAWSPPAPFLWNPVPVIPTNLVATENGAEVALSWNDNSTDEESFVIERSTSPSGDFAVMQVLDANETTATDVPADYGLNYYYRVKAVNDAGSSGWSNVDSVFWAPAPNGSIQLQIEEIDDRVFELTWESTVTYHQHFIVERSLGNDKIFEPVDTVSAGTHVYLDTLDTAQAYYYRVVAYNPSGVIVSNEVWVLSPDLNAGPPIEIYPNSFQDVIVVKGRDVNGSFAIISSDGRKQELRATSTPEGVSLDASMLPSGLYIIQFSNDEGSWSQKLMKRL